MAEALVYVNGRAEPLRISVNGIRPTFTIGTDRIRAAASTSLDPLDEDLLDIAGAVFAADSDVGRGGATRSDFGAGWRRNFDFVIPVGQPAVWTQADVTEALTDAVEFLTGDAVSFRFVDRTEPAWPQGMMQFGPASSGFEAADVILFSGGLDSYAGALERLSTSSVRVILLSHQSAQKVIPRQNRLAASLSERFPGRVLHLRVSARRVGTEGVETTQRSRSLLFAALGQAVAGCFGATRVSFYENGIVSHNLPISPQVVGTMATRTTHPQTLTRLNALMRRLRPEPVTVVNEYQWLTKTEVVTRIAQFGGQLQIGQAVSCTSVRDQGILRTHCGRCSQCLDRRFAILAAGLEQHDPSESYHTDVLTGARETAPSQVMATEWVRHALRLRHLDDQAFLAAFGSEMTRVLAGHPNMSRTEALRLSCDLHRRHAASVQHALEGAIRAQASAIAAQELPSTSLLRLHCGTSAILSVSMDDLASLAKAMAVDDGPDGNFVPNPTAPLSAAFLREGKQFVVAIQGLGRINGRGADVAHQLKPHFDDDRSKGLAPDAHQFVTPRQILLSGKDASKEAVRASVARCRRSLATLYKEMHGELPAEPLLIQSRQNKGYRLDPTLRITDTSEH